MPPPSEANLDIGYWNVCGARLQVLAHILLARVGLVMLQEVTVGKETEFWEGYGCMWCMKSQDHKCRVNVMGVRKDIKKKPDFEIHSADDNYIVGSIKTARVRLKLVNLYLPPESSRHYDLETINKLGDLGADSVVCGDMIWVGNASMQAAIPDSERMYDSQNGKGKKYTTKRDEDIWVNWPRALRTSGPRPNSGAVWTTRTCWRTLRRTRCDDMLFPRWSSTACDDLRRNSGIVNSHHDMITGTRGWRTWAAPPADIAQFGQHIEA